MKIDEEKLRKKGYSDHEIDRTLTILKYGKSNQANIFNKRITKEVVFWVSIIVAVIGNAILAFLLIPFLIISEHRYIYAIIITFALGYGYIFNFLMEDIEFVFPKHHVISGLIIPVVAVVTIYITVNVTNVLLGALNIQPYDPFIISTVYIAAFVIPFLYSNTPKAVNRVFAKDL